MREIRLANGRGVALVDDADYDELSAFRWYLLRGYAARSDQGSSVLMHRQILRVKPGQMVDHRDRNRLNNQRNNLRLVTFAQNNANVGIPRNNTSGFRGVSHDTRTGRWKAHIKRKGRLYYIGSFSSARQAAIARDAFAIIFYGIEYAYLNFPEFFSPDD